MKRRFVAASLVIIALFFSCTKEPVRSFSSKATVAPVNDTDNEPFASGWEPISEWATIGANNEVSFSKALPVSGGKHAVLVFTKNVWDDDLTVEEAVGNEPLALPYNILPFNKEPGYVETWTYKTENDELQVKLSVNGAIQPASVNKKIELQYIVIPEQLLAQKGESEQSIRLMSYEELVHKFGLAAQS